MATKRTPEQVPQHGTYNGYSNYGCKCELCRAAGAEWRRQRYVKKARAPRVPQHGTTSEYGNHGCRCDLCRAAKAEASHARYTANKEAVYAQLKSWRESNPERYLATRRAGQRRRRAENPEKHRAKYKQWLQANPDVAKAAQIAWKERNPDRVRATQVAWVSANRERVLEKQREWQRRNRVRIAAYGAQRRSRLGTENGTVEDRDWRRLVRRFDGRCAYCGIKDRPLTMDHILPISRDGRHTIGNVLPACKSCNSSKRDYLLVEWRARRQRAVA